MRAADWNALRGMSRARRLLADFSAMAGKPFASSAHGAWLPRGDLVLIARISSIDRILTVAGRSLATAVAHAAIIRRLVSPPSFFLWRIKARDPSWYSNSSPLLTTAPEIVSPARAPRVL